MDSERRLLRLKGVLDITPVSRATWYRWVKAGKAPQAERIGERISAWWSDEVLATAESLCERDRT